MINSQPSHRTESIGAHLSPEKLFQLLADQVSPTEKKQLEAHLRQCPLCTDALEGFARANTSVSQATLLELNHLIKKRTARRKPNTLLTDIKTWGVATAIVFLILISAAIVWNVAHTTVTPPNRPKAPATATNLSLYAKPVKGYDHLKSYIKQQAKSAPLPAGATRKKGKVILSFSVNPDSSLSDFKVIKSLGPATDKLAIELIKKGPTWQPANQKGQNITQKITLPIVFK